MGKTELRYRFSRAAIKFFYFRLQLVACSLNPETMATTTNESDKGGSARPLNDNYSPSETDKGGSVRPLKDKYGPNKTDNGGSVRPSKDKYGPNETVVAEKLLQAGAI